MTKLIDKANEGYDGFSSLRSDFIPSLPVPERLVTQPLMPAEFVSRLREAMDTQLPTQGAVMDMDGVVHGIIGNYTLCDRKWAHLASPREGWCGWNALGESDVDCLECIGDA